MKGIIGVGNPLKGDDGIGVKLVEEIEKRKISKDIETFSVGSDNFAVLHILKDLSRVIIIDAVRFGGEPGEYCFFSPDEVESLRESKTAHGTDIIEVLNLSEKLDERPAKVLIMGIEPGDTVMGEGLSEPVRERVPEMGDALQKKSVTFFSGV